MTDVDFARGPVEADLDVAWIPGTPLPSSQFRLQVPGVQNLPSELNGRAAWRLPRR